MTSFIARFLNIHRSGVLTALAWLVPHETAAVSAQVLCTPYNHASCHIMQSHIRKVNACLAVTCHLHFWQNDRDLLRATAVTRGWNRYRNKCQHGKSTLEKKILPPFRRGFEHATFQSLESGALTTELSPLPGEKKRRVNLKALHALSKFREPVWPSGKAQRPRFESTSALLSLQKLW